jgi:pSer/pThr/pTyr-binding forkhead associated (FHA) protein
MKLVLEVTSGPLEGQQIVANIGETVSIGRTPKASNPVADNFMSGAHFAVECGADGCRLRDLNSRNGTKLNGELVTEAVIKTGDQIHAGRTNFIVRIETVPKSESVPAPAPLKPSEVATKAVAQKPSSRGKKSEKIESPATPISEKVPPPERSSRRQVTSVEPAPQIESPPPPPPIERVPPPTPPAEVIPAAALDSYEAATPDGRLLHILSNQPQTLMALIDAIHDAQVLELLRNTREEYQSLYRSDKNASIAPYLVRLPPRSELLKQMIQRGWGHQWGVYLTSPLSLPELREHFRTSLMVSMPDGMELFSRFYDPIFFRTFLQTCTADEADKFFGPITSYFMEDERPEILLQFTKSKSGAEKKGHLLSDLA